MFEKRLRARLPRTVARRQRVLRTVGRQGSQETRTRAHGAWKTAPAEYDAPPLDEGIDEALRDFVARKKAKMPDKWYSLGLTPISLPLYRHRGRFYRRTDATTSRSYGRFRGAVVSRHHRTTILQRGDRGLETLHDDMRRRIRVDDG